MNPFKRKATSEPSILQTRWFGSLLSFCILLLIVAAFVEFYWRAERYANQTIKNEFNQQANAQEKIPLFCELKNKPGWLAATILDTIFAETQEFAARDQATYDRLQNPQDQAILREIADNYTGTDAKGINHWAVRDNAWIKKITEVRRVIAKDRKSQTIEIYAEYRVPAAWVLVSNKCYLIDDDFVRLPSHPHDYSPADRKSTPGLMAITGVEFPPGQSSVPAPSAVWNTPDLAAGMKLVNLLRSQRFVSQIDSIDMTNYQGRKDSRQLWVVLNTIWPTSADAARPRVIQWGRPLGEERFYDVSAASKLKALNQIFMRYNRIDANRDYVDIHTEQIWIPKLTSQPEDPQPRTPRG